MQTDPWLIHFDRFLLDDSCGCVNWLRLVGELAGQLGTGVPMDFIKALFGHIQGRNDPPTLRQEKKGPATSGQNKCKQAKQ